MESKATNTVEFGGGNNPHILRHTVQRRAILGADGE